MSAPLSFTANDLKQGKVKFKSQVLHYDTVIAKQGAEVGTHALFHTSVNKSESVRSTTFPLTESEELYIVGIQAFNRIRFGNADFTDAITKTEEFDARDAQQDFEAFSMLEIKRGRTIESPIYLSQLITANWMNVGYDSYVQDKESKFYVLQEPMHISNKNFTMSFVGAKGILTNPNLGKEIDGNANCYGLRFNFQCVAIESVQFQ
jgi:hypothetical protein